MLNALSIDLEDWFCVNSLSHAIKRKDWDKYELRIYNSTQRILKLLKKYEVKATFFVLGWIAERVPELVLEIERENHEIALHSYNHLLITNTTPEEFEEDLKKSLDILKKIGVKQEIIGFRAPSFTIVEKTKWALNILEKYNIIYDSSVFPMNLSHSYGMPDAPLSPYNITERMYEFPISCVEILGKRFPCGGAYFRILPCFYTKYCLKKINRENRPFLLYLHPWELDPDHPRIKGPFLRKFGHYYNLNKTEHKLEILLKKYQFTTIREVLGL